MRPLLISDCDEVLLEFARPFGDWLARDHDLTLSLDSFALTGNIRRTTGEAIDPAEFPPLLKGFFAGAQHTQPAVAGAVAALERLSAIADIVILTNIEQAHHGAREGVLAALGMPYRLICNDGAKGPPVADLARGRTAVFVDDLPPNHGSVARHAPDVWRLHMVADERLRAMLPPAPDAHARIDRWSDAEPWIAARLQGEPL